MAELVECVPNFSEGRDGGVVDQIVAAMEAVPGTRLLDRSMDAGHNRAVVTLIGDGEAVAEAAFKGVAEAVKLIDLRTHRGEHPRIGAADVVPFVPLRGTPMERCVEIARRVGERIGRELAVPVFLYEEAATRPERRDLAEIRRPQFEGLLKLVSVDPAWQPDFGPNALHPAAGAVAVGARPLLVAYNVYLNTSDQKTAKGIARAVRHRTGGLRHVKALGLAADARGYVQVSMNLTNTDETPMHRVVEMVRSEAARYGVAVVESEVVGLVSADALLGAAEHYLQLNRFSRGQVLEYRLLEEEMAPSSGPTPPPAPPPQGEGSEGPPSSPALPPSEGEGRGTSIEREEGLLAESVGGFADRVAEGGAVPGGGAVAALIGALGSALVTMVARLTKGRRRFAGVEGRIGEIEGRAEALRQRLLGLVEGDAAAYTCYMEAARQARAGHAEAEGALRDAALRATMVPLETARACIEAMALALEVAKIGNPAARTDAAVAALAAHAAVLAGVLNVRTNLPLLSPEQHPEEIEAEAESLLRRASGLLPRALALGRR